MAAGARDDFRLLKASSFIFLTAVGIVAGAVGWAIVRKVAKGPEGLVRWLAPTLVVVSFVPDFLEFGDGSAVGVGTLILIHVVGRDRRGVHLAQGYAPVVGSLARHRARSYGRGSVAGAGRGDGSRSGVTCPRRAGQGGVAPRPGVDAVKRPPRVGCGWACGAVRIREASC
ncbi:hypothetical protein AB0M32_16390 [Streptomyces sp. NPDC051985]|uniref:hypothetical protein n=1 Tax=Streptomyces sp. NPDC051985 TaxID=3155807 RepID=UPI00343E3BA8